MTNPTKGDLEASGELDEGQQGLHLTRLDGESAFAGAIAMAVNYRGDVTIEQQQGERIVCFVFDRTDTLIRYMTSSGVRASISIDEVEGIVFSGKDPAVGVTFERWIERYVERTLAGEEASLHGDESA